jgi:hypothetical protein
MQVTKSNLIPQMKYVVQCYISDKTGASIRINEFTFEQLKSAYYSAYEYYGGVLPVPDSGRYEDFTV